MSVISTATLVAKEIESTLSAINEDQCQQLVKLLMDRKTVFFAGAGRSSFMLKAAVMRLMHMGYNSYFVGETSTPSIQENDLLIIGSGSGETESLVVKARKAKKLGAVVVLISIFPNSSIGEIADVIIQIPATTLKSAQSCNFHSIQPQGNLFEQCMLLILESVVIELMQMKGLLFEDMFKRHANLE